MTEILVVGSHAPGLMLRVSRPPALGETVIGWGFEEPVDGGKGSNQAIAAARLGGSVAFAGCLGRDRYGETGYDLLREQGVDVTYIRRTDTPTGVGFIMLNRAGVPAMVTYLGANAEVSRKDVDRALDGTPESSVLLTQFEIPLDVALHAARRAQREGKTVIVNPAPATTEPTGDLDGVILVPNETEAKVLLGLDPDGPADAPDLAARLQTQTGAASVVITLGEAGVVGRDEDGIWHVPAPAVVAVDTSGAGDAFCAALAVELAAGRTLRDAAVWACSAAALSVTHPGTIDSYPTREDVEQHVRLAQ